MKLSVIIPLFNCEKYIGRCLDSVLSQVIENAEIEVIVIDDGSTDSGGIIADVYERKYSSVRVFHQQNQGVSAARNQGIKLASGNYIHFLDSDDFLLFNDSYQYLLGVINTTDPLIDVLCFSMLRLYNPERVRLSDYYNLDSAVVSFQGTGREACARSKFEGFIGPVLYNAELLKTHLITFDSSIMWAEDVFFNLRVYAYAQNVIYTNACIYGYYCNPDSVTLNVDRKKLKKLLDNVIENTPAFLELLETFNLPGFKLQRQMSRAHVLASRLLSLNASYRMTKEYINKGFECGLLPFSSYGSSSKFHRLLDILMRYPFCFWLMSFVYRYIFNPLIKPLLLQGKNN